MYISVFLNRCVYVNYIHMCGDLVHAYICMCVCVPVMGVWCLCCGV